MSEALGHLTLGDERRFCLDELVAELAEAQARLRRVEGRIRALAAEARHAPAVAVLVSHPAVGPVTAMTFRTELHHAGRFRDGAAVGQYLGLAPRVRQSGPPRPPRPVLRGTPSLRPSPAKAEGGNETATSRIASPSWARYPRPHAR